MRRACYIILTVLVIASTVMWIAVVRPAQQFDRWWNGVFDRLEELRGQPPPDMPRKKWEYLVDWTVKAHAYCFIPRYILDRSRFEEFRRESEIRLAGPSDPAVIEWFWDELERISSEGPLFSKLFRPSRPHRLRLYGFAPRSR